MNARVSPQLTTARFFEPGDLPLLVINNPHHGQTHLHRHEFYEMVFIERGVALHSYEGNTEILTAGDLFIILPGESHSYISTNNTALYNCLFLPAAVSGLRDDLTAVKPLAWLVQGLAHGRLKRAHAGVAERQEIVLRLNQIIWERGGKPLGWQLRCKALLIDLLVTYARLCSNPQSQRKPGNANYRHVLKAVSWLENHYTGDLDMAALAQQTKLSSGYLARQFKAFLGTTPAEYARSFRMAKAADLLRDESRSVADVAKELGFSDLSLFSRQFRSVTGQSPSLFRKRQDVDTVGVDGE